MISFDTEMFIDDEGELVPASRCLSGSKENPTQIDEQFQAHPDNVMAEIAPIKPFIVDSFVDVVKQAKTAIAKACGLPLRIVSQAEFPTATLESDPEAGTIGCDVDFLNGLPRQGVTITELGNYRCAGGHLHFDINPELGIPEHVAAAVCDHYIGLWLVAQGEKQGFRRQTYGLAGLYRPKPYGVEYRTPSNFWFGLPDNKLEAFGTRVRLVSDILEGTDTDPIRAVMQTRGEVVSMINNEDREAAVQFLEGVS